MKQYTHTKEQLTQENTNKHTNSGSNFNSDQSLDLAFWLNTNRHVEFELSYGSEGF